jgi:hypothetical protein
MRHANPMRLANGGGWVQIERRWARAPLDKEAGMDWVKTDKDSGDEEVKRDRFEAWRRERRRSTKIAWSCALALILGCALASAHAMERPCFSMSSSEG